MHAPHKAASYLFGGLGVGLLLSTGFALQQGRMSLSTLSLGHVILGVGLVSLLLSYLTLIGKGPLANSFPNESLEQLSERLHSEFHQEEKYERVSNAWAELEANVLSTELGDSEE
jgi:hypothetical protein